MPKLRSRSRSRSSTLASGAGYWWYLVPGFVLVMAIIVVPLGQNIYYSFTFYRGIRPPEWVGLQNWQHLMHDDKFWQSFENSIAMIIAMVVVPTLVGLLIASVLFDLVGKKFGGKVASFLRATYYIPQIIPVVVAAIVVGWIARPQDGALNEMLGAVGLDGAQRNWLGDPTWALPTIMAVLIWVQLGYPVVVFMAALQRVDPELYEAAELDGANWWNRFRAITLAVIRPEIFVVTLTCTIAALKVFAPVYALTRGGPGTSTIVPSYYSYSEFFQSQQVGYGATISTALTVVIILVATVFLIAQRRVERQEEQR
ncbi:sugar ABC transporter permease [Nocardioides sp. CER19]|uniref:carbohydrate ABC transporter permease n=1 Tax=Nocardioides sp. CER19 TaxID=3038538 RepID=UPI00244D1B5B|nr:sugar ABC transporter permease [Nocardioides sp. CER19]MDH2413269.1 sugar ABC transporter permease [Nocardioides sp. CER19]